MPYQVGDVVVGCITGIQPYGAFIKIDDKYSGLLHISEISNDYVQDVHLFVRLHEEIRIKIIDVNRFHCKLSLKALQKSSRVKNHTRQVDPLPVMEKGFQSLKEVLDEWIKQQKV